MWDDIFLIPFLTGLCLALALPILGCFLRLRDEWLAALAYAGRHAVEVERDHQRVGAELLTSYGLRSLAPANGFFRNDWPVVQPSPCCCLAAGH